MMMMILIIRYFQNFELVGKRQYILPLVVGIRSDRLKGQITSVRLLDK